MASTCSVYLRHASRKFNGQAGGGRFLLDRRSLIAITADKRLGYAAGIFLPRHQMLDYVKELDGVQQPVCIIWGDRDSRRAGRKCSTPIVDIPRA